MLCPWEGDSDRNVVIARKVNDMRPGFGLHARYAAAIALVASLVLSSMINPMRHALATSDIYIITLDDINIADLWQHTFIPDFEKKYPQYQVHYTNILHGDNAQNIVIDRLVAAQSAGKKSIQFDLMDDSPLNYGYPTGKTYKDYFIPLGPAQVPNAEMIDPFIRSQAAGYAVPYQASAVTLAYNSQVVSNPPKTYMQLIAWIKAHPGKFTYCPPDKGGTGDYFVASAILSVSNPALYKKPYNKANEASWPKAWALLQSIEPDLFQGGFHPAGNIATLNLLAKGAISMATVWSDQGLSAQDKGILPKYIHFTQISPPFAGGPTFVAIPGLAQNKAGAEAYLNFVLSPAEQAKQANITESFPAIEYKYVPAAVVTHFGSLATLGYGFWPGSGPYDIDLVNGWKSNVPHA